MEAFHPQALLSYESERSREINQLSNYLVDSTQTKANQFQIVATVGYPESNHDFLSTE